jgi:hypothetical protein
LWKIINNEEQPFMFGAVDIDHVSDVEIEFPYLPLSYPVEIQETGKDESGAVVFTVIDEKEYQAAVLAAKKGAR